MHHIRHACRSSTVTGASPEYVRALAARKSPPLSFLLPPSVEEELWVGAPEASIITRQQKRGACMAHETTLLIVPAFGIDTLVVAVGLGAGVRVPRWRLAFTLAAFEGGMPVVGAFVGRELAHLVADAVYFAAALLAVLAVREVVDGIRELRGVGGEEEDGRGPGEEAEKGDAQALHRAGSGLALLGAGLAVSLDELTAGVAAGAARLDLRILAPALALQAIVFTWLGVTAGGRLTKTVGQYGEVAGGVALLAAAGVLVLLGGSKV